MTVKVSSDHLQNETDQGVATAVLSLGAMSLVRYCSDLRVIIVRIGVGAGGDRGIGPPPLSGLGDNPPSFFDVFVTCLWCITLGLHLRTVSQCIMTAPPAARAMQGLSNRRVLCVEIPRD